MATAIPGTTYQRGQDVAKTGTKGTGVIAQKLTDFYATARGHLVNKYQVYFYGPYVEEALHVMDRNSYADKYDIHDVKVFPNTIDYYKKAQFDDWMSACWNVTDRTLCMRWNAKSIMVPGAKADIDWCMIDSMKSMAYPLIKANQRPQSIKLTVLDDNYLLWFHFFNALYNVQFTPLMLKPRSTMQKINMYVNLYQEAITMGRSHDRRTWVSNKDLDIEPVITDLDVGQMFEFNSCILHNAPEITMSYDDDKQYQFNAELSYPNSFQGSYKEKFRYLRDNTTKGVDIGNAVVRRRSDTSQYGDYNKAFYEAGYEHWQARKSAYIDDAYNPNDYDEYKKTHPAAFKSSTDYGYDLHSEYRSIR